MKAKFNFLPLAFFQFLRKNPMKLLQHNLFLTKQSQFVNFFNLQNFDKISVFFGAFPIGVPGPTGNNLIFNASSHLFDNSFPSLSVIAYSGGPSSHKK